MYNGIQNVPWYFLGSKKKKGNKLSENSRNYSVLHYRGVLARKKKENLSSLFCGECHAIECAL